MWLSDRFPFISFVRLINFNFFFVWMCVWIMIRSLFTTSSVFANENQNSWTHLRQCVDNTLAVGRQAADAIGVGLVVAAHCVALSVVVLASWHVAGPSEPLAPSDTWPSIGLTDAVWTHSARPAYALSSVHWLELVVHVRLHSVFYYWPLICSIVCYLLTIRCRLHFVCDRNCSTCYRFAFVAYSCHCCFSMQSTCCLATPMKFSATLCVHPDLLLPLLRYHQRRGSQVAVMCRVRLARISNKTPWIRIPAQSVYWISSLDPFSMPTPVTM